jgi:hypothetical protein
MTCVLTWRLIVWHEIADLTSNYAKDRVSPRRYPPSLNFLEESRLEREMHGR